MTVANSTPPSRPTPMEAPLTLDQDKRGGWVEEPVRLQDGSWRLRRYRDVKTVLHDSRFSSRLGEIKPSAHFGGATWLVRIKDQLAGLLKPHVADSSDPLQRLRGRWIPLSDPPDHTRLRGSVKAPFTTRLPPLRPKIRARAEQFIAQGRAAGTVDIDADFAFPITAQTMMELFGYDV